ncbi:MAG: aminotransferase class I/II-fold pyridoxal phosphate-dependent enzyme, partial [Acidobacteria bacterium]|nr:aminotransferase class I/II-fold pyridoxal phosphate-dependent enzyme [Acidobacteriota bacterium]
YGLAVANGTIAIEIALKAIGIQPGDEVIVPAYTWEGTVGPILLLNAVPVFVDVDPDTYCLDARLIEQALTPETRAILSVHLALRFADLDEILRIARAHKLAVMEDCAHAHGGKWRNRGVGASVPAAAECAVTIAVARTTHLADEAHGRMRARPLSAQSLDAETAAQYGFFPLLAAAGREPSDSAPV